jgi:RND family efflux transporter MFP subunit
MTKKSSLFTPFGLAAIAATLAACAPSRAETEAKEVTAERTRAPIAVTLAPVTLIPIDNELALKGRVSHARDVRVAFKTGGIIKELLVDEGERVTMGQPIARLDTGELDAGLAQARAGLAKANRDLSRATDLEKEAVLPGATREDAQTARAVAAAQVAQIRWNRDTATLFATTDGVVIKRLAEPGEVVGPGQPVLVIGEEGPAPRLEVGLPARERARAVLGQQVSVTFDGSTTRHEGRIVDVAPTLTPGTDRIAITIEVAAATGSSELLPRGLVGTVVFPARTTPTLPAIPLSTLVEGDGKRASVWVIAAADGLVAETGSHAVTRREVIVREFRPDGKALIASGLEGVDAVIDAGQAWLDATATVKVVKTGETDKTGNTEVTP